jgi:lipopolysaccharide biosynthesis glycosyltransferase
MTEAIECVFSTDDNYAQHLGVAIASLAENNRHHRLSLHIVHHGVTPDNLRLLGEQIGTYENVAAAFHAFDAEPFSHFPIRIHLSLASYFRLFLTQLLPAQIKRALYLDADLVVRGDIGPLWRAPLNGNLIAAAPDPLADSNERLSLPPDYCYFNAGVLLIDLDGWRREGLLPRFIDYIETHEAVLKFLDQDVLNVLLQDRVEYLDYGWNFQSRTESRHRDYLGLTSAEFEAVRGNPRIIHFSSRWKPWFYRHDVPFEAEYLKYLARTPWADKAQPDRNAKAMISRTIKRRLPVLRRLYARLHA